MTERVHQHEEFVKLSDSDLRLKVPEQDVRGLDVYERGGDPIGSVEDLYVDEQERKVRFLEVGAGGFLGMGEKHFLIPAEAVASVGEDGVTIDQSREKVAGYPPFDPDVVPEASYRRGLYDYYGYPYPY
jgi:sporulation protein YlmC with PRC-barrel domain